MSDQEANLFVRDNLVFQTEPNDLAVENIHSGFGDISEEGDWAVGGWYRRHQASLKLDFWRKSLFGLFLKDLLVKTVRKTSVAKLV